MDVFELISKAYEFTDKEKQIWRKLKFFIELVAENGEEQTVSLESADKKIEVVIRKKINS